MAYDEIGRGIGAPTVGDGRKVVAAAGTAEALSDTSLLVNSLLIVAETDNTGVIAVGGSTVVATVLTRRGAPLLAGEALPLGPVDLADIYLDATVAGDGVTYMYLRRA